MLIMPHVTAKGFAKLLLKLLPVEIILRVHAQY